MRHVRFLIISDDCDESCAYRITIIDVNLDALDSRQVRPACLQLAYSIHPNQLCLRVRHLRFNVGICIVELTPIC